MIRRVVALVLLAVVTVGAVPALRRRLDAALVALGTSSPGVGVYETLFARLLAGVYQDIAAEAIAAVDQVERPEILEIGPGPGHVAERILTARDDARMVALDIDADMLSAAALRLAKARVRERANLVKGDVAEMPFGDATFDLVISSLSAHHWADPPAAFAEILRVLRPGGRALCYDVPAWWGTMETGSEGLEGAARVFVQPEVSDLRSLGPLTVLRRLEVRAPDA